MHPSAAFRLSAGTTQVSISGRLEALQETTASRADGYLVWQDAFGRDAHVLRRFEADGFEDFVAFESAPQSAELVYSIHLDANVAGLRLVADSLEFLDDSGTPRLRVARPSIVSSDGIEHDAHLDVTDCQVDRDAAAPWGRPVVAAGAADCTVRVTWDAESITYPALVDPSWVTTGNMVETRSLHTADVLASGRVLVVGGTGSGAVRQTAELYDPATRTWAATGSMVGPRSAHTSHLLADGRVLVAGGSTGTSALATSETYSASTGTWTQVGNLSGARASHMGTALGDGRVLLSGGAGSTSGSVLGTVDLFNPQTNTWSSAGSMSTPRAGARAITLADGRVLVSGGRTTSGTCIGTAELFSPASGSWSPTGSMAAPRCDYAGRRLPDGTVIVATGYTDATLVPVNSVEVFNPATGVWRTSMGKVPVASRGAATALVSTGNMILSGGFGATANALAEASAYVLATSSSWSQFASLAQPRTGHTMTPLGTSQVLVAGGWDETGASSNRADTQSLQSAERADGARNSLRNLTMEWELPTMVRLPSSAGVGVNFRNLTGGPVSGTLTVVAWTPDGRRLARPLRTINIPPCRLVTGAPCPLTISASAEGGETNSVDETASAMAAPGWIEIVMPDSVPVQPVGLEGLFHIEFNKSGDDGFGLATSNVFYKFTPGYSGLQLNGERGSESLLTPQIYGTAEAYFAGLTPFLDGLGPVQGRIRTPGNTWEDIRNGLPQADEFEVGGGLPFTGRFNPDRPEYGPPEDLISFFFPEKRLEVEFIPVYGWRKICAVFDPDFRDDPYGQPPQPASFARASFLAPKVIHSIPETLRWAPVWTDRLDADGCTPAVSLPAGNYNLIVEGDMVSPDGKHISIKEGSVAQGSKLAVWNLGMKVRSPFANPSSPVTMRIPAGRAANVGMLASRILQLGTDGPPVAEYGVEIYASADDCKAYTGLRVGALINYGKLLLCPNATSKPGDHNALYRFVIGHEFGHYAELRGNSIPWQQGVSNPYTWKDGVPVPFPPLCKCDFIPADDGLHCLQSQESYGAASKEGFGHFYATRAWNSIGTASPTFQYYKEFMEPGSTVARPAGSKFVNVRQAPIKWSDTHCADSKMGRGTEYDFLGFYWAINAAPANQRTSMPEFMAIMKALRENMGSTETDGSWVEYRAAAAEVYGSADSRFLHFLEKGPAFGVDH